MDPDEITPVPNTSQASQAPNTSIDPTALESNASQPDAHLAVYLYPRPADQGNDESSTSAVSDSKRGCNLSCGIQWGEVPQKFARWKISHSLIGWKFSLRVGALLATVVFAMNAAILIWTLASHHEIGNGRAVLYRGNCQTVRSKNTWIHLYINVASTLLLSASNFSMQCLSAPTRKDTDRGAFEEKVDGYRHPKFSQHLSTGQQESHRLVAPGHDFTLAPSLVSSHSLVALLIILRTSC